MAPEEIIPGSDSQWVRLAPRVRQDTLNALDLRLQRDLRNQLATAGIRYRIEPSTGHVLIRAEPATGSHRLLVLKALQRADGSFREDAADALRMPAATDVDLGGLPGALGAVPGANLEEDLNRPEKMTLDLIAAEDPVAVLREWHRQQPALRFYRARPTRRFLLRGFFMRIFDELADGVAVDELEVGRDRTTTHMTGGLLEVAPAAVVAAPLVARLQPFAQVFLTRAGAQVVAVPERGGFLRPVSVERWPAGLSGLPELAGPGEGLYKGTPSTFAAQQGLKLLREMADGTNGLFHYLTDPAQHRTAFGRYDHAVRSVLYASVLFGFESIVTIGADWNPRHSIWHAFRALGTLQAIWDGSRTGAVSLGDLLHPHRVAAHALPTVQTDAHRQWMDAVVHRYAGMVRGMFPERDLDSAVQELSEIRNLVHGAVTNAGHRTRRLDVLRAAARSEAQLQLIVDIAVFWWTAALLDPANMLRFGEAPWERGVSA